MNKAVKDRSSERGGAGIKFLAVAVVLILIANAGFHFIPVAYNGESFKSDIHTAVVQGLAAPGKVSPVDLVKQRINASIKNNDIPSDVFVEVKQVSNSIQAHVVYSQKIPILPFGIYNYDYQFNETIAPVGYLTKQ